MKQTFENLKLHPQFVSSNRKILDHVANFHLPDTDKSGKPTYIQTLARTKRTSDKINQFVLASGNILDGSIPNNKLDELSKIGVGEPEISFDKETGFHKVSFDMLVYSDKKSLLSADKHGRPEVVFSSRDEKKVQQFVTQFLNNYHYKKFNIDDSLSSKIYTNYLNDLDRGKNYFVKSEIDNFEKYRYSFDEAILSGDLTAPYEIFNFNY